MKYSILFLLLFICFELTAQTFVNQPIHFQDSTNIEYIKEYWIDNFVCEDTNLIILELDDLGRIKKQSKYLKNELQEVTTHIKDESRNLYIKTIKEKFVSTKFQKAGIITHDYVFDESDNITMEIISTEQDSIIEKTEYEYDSENRLIKMTYLIVPKRFHGSKPPLSYETISYDSEKNEKTIQKFNQDGKFVKTKTTPIRVPKEQPEKGKLTLTVKGEYEGSKTRTEYEFHDLGFWIRKVGYMDFNAGEGKLYTKFREVKFRD